MAKRMKIDFAWRKFKQTKNICGDWNKTNKTKHLGGVTHSLKCAAAHPQNLKIESIIPIYYYLNPWKFVNEPCNFWIFLINYTSLLLIVSHEALYVGVAYHSCVWIIFFYLLLDIYISLHIIIYWTFFKQFK